MGSSFLSPPAVSTAELPTATKSSMQSHLYELQKPSVSFLGLEGIL